MRKLYQNKLLVLLGLLLFYSLRSYADCTTTVTITGDTVFCKGGCTTLDAGAGYLSYLWSTGEATQTISYCGQRSLKDQLNLSIWGSPKDSTWLTILIGDSTSYFQLDSAGTTLYTKNGQFNVDNTGEIVFESGGYDYKLLPNITVPVNASCIIVTPYGQVEAIVCGSGSPTVLGQIQLAKFANPAGLDNHGNGIYAATLSSGAPLVGNPGDSGFGFLISPPGGVCFQGDAFFQLQDTDGTFVYTRTCSTCNCMFTIDAFGRIVYRANGFVLQPGITVPLSSDSVTVDTNGDVYAWSGGSSTMIGQITLARFINSLGLTSLGDNLYAESVASGPPDIGTAYSFCTAIITNRTYSVFVTVTDTSGCTGSACVTLHMVQDTISITGNTNVCDGGSTILDAGVHSTYSWSTGANTETITVSNSSSVSDQLQLCIAGNAKANNWLQMNVCGSGYFIFTAHDGTTVYSRSSAFSTDPTGTIINTETGFPLNPSIVIPNCATSVNIDSSGQVTCVVGGSTLTLGQIQLAIFPDSTGLAIYGIWPDFYQATALSGSPTVSNPGTGGTGLICYTYAPTGYNYSGDWFFEVQFPTGVNLYTRDGGFTTDPSGVVIQRSSGLPVQPSLTVPAGIDSMHVSADGIVTCYTGGLPTVIGQIYIVNFANSLGLTYLGGGLYSESYMSGTPVISTPCGYCSPPLIHCLDIYVAVTDSGVCIKSGHVKVNFSPGPPKPVITASGPTAFCVGDSVMLDAGDQSGICPKFGGFLWSNGATTQQITVTMGGKYAVTVCNIVGCCTTSDTITIFALRADAGPDTCIYPGDSVRIGGSPTALYGVPPFTYSWSPTAGLSDPTVANPYADSANTYVVTVTDSLGCISTDTVIVSTCTNLTLILDTVYATGGSEVLVSASVKGFRNILSLQYTINWDASIASFVQTEAYNLPGMSSANFGTTLVGGGNLTFSWNDSTLHGVTVPNGTVIFQIRFLAGAVGECTALNYVGVPTLIEAVDTSYAVVPYSIINGRLCIVPADTISGAIVSELGDPVPTVTLNVTGSQTLSETTGSDGLYNINTLLPGGNITITPSKNNDIMTDNGVTTLDLLLIIRDMYGIVPLSSPYKLIAADVNSDGAITLLDILEARQLILHIINTFGGKLWSFVPADYIFPDPTDPFSPLYPSFRDYTSVTSSFNQNFIGMKLGDVNNSWNPIIPRENYSGKVFVDVPSRIVLPGETITIPVTTSQFTSLSGYQFTVNWDPSVLSYEGVENGATKAFYGLSMKSEGALAVEWTADNAGDLTLTDETPLFYLTFKAVGVENASSPVRISSSLTPVEVVNNDLNLVALESREGRIDIGKSTSAGDDLVKVYPNPTSGDVSVSYSISSSKGTLQLYDVLGKLLGTYELDGSKSLYQLNVSQFCCGVIEYRVLDNKNVAGRGQIVILNK